MKDGRGEDTTTIIPQLAVKVGIKFIRLAVARSQADALEVLLLLLLLLLLLQLECACIRLAAKAKVGFPRLLNLVVKRGKRSLDLCPYCVWVSYITPVTFHFDPLMEYNASCTVKGTDGVERLLNIKYPLPI